MNDESITPPEEVIRTTEQSYPGDGRTLNDAFNNAWDKGKRDGHRAFRVQTILVWGENPISGYRVILGPVG
jgi:hypothetical protein